MGKINVNFVLVQLKRQTKMNIEEVYNIVQYNPILMSNNFHPFIRKEISCDEVKFE